MSIKESLLLNRKANRLLIVISVYFILPFICVFQLAGQVDMYMNKAQELRTALQAVMVCM